MPTTTIDSNAALSTLATFMFHVAMVQKTTFLLLGTLIAAAVGASANFAVAPDIPPRSTRLTCMVFAFALQLGALVCLGVIEHFARLTSPPAERFVGPTIAFLTLTIVSVLLMFVSLLV
ncbi:hypothetical protein FRB90_011379 [Tulasnella sp. 427]|nr:hypothetical protein FRB90_011379 [Tulasnella sp. 427]